MAERMTEDSCSPRRPDKHLERSKHPDKGRKTIDLMMKTMQAMIMTTALQARIPRKHFMRALEEKCRR